MSVTLVSTGGLFKRIGRFAGAMADLVALQGGPATARVLSGASMATRGTNLEADAAESPSVSVQLGDHWQAISSWRSIQSGIMSAFTNACTAELIQQVDLDAGLSERSLNAAMTELIAQMESSGDDINASSISAGAQTAVGSPTGDPVIVVALTNGRGQALQTVFAEKIRFKVTGDSQSGAGTLRGEPMSVRGEAQASGGVFAYDYPQGSGGSTSLNLADAQRDNSGGNKLYNSDFETFTTANHPDDWVVELGAVGTNIFAAGSGDALTQSNALEITGDGGGTLTSLYQSFNTSHSTTADAGGTPATLLPKTHYALCLNTKVSATISAGVLQIALVDGSGTVIADDEGTNNALAIDLTAETTSYDSHTAVFRTPSALPAAVRLRIKLTTAIDSGDSVFVDDLALAEMTSLYPGGPSVAAFAGATAVASGDEWTVTVSATWGVMADWCERMFSLRSQGLVIPYDAGGTETIADSLVQ